MNEIELWKWLFVDDAMTRHFACLRDKGATPSEAFFYKKYPLSFVPHPKDFSADDPIVNKLKAEHFYRLSCILQGKATVSADDGTMELFAGDAVIDRVSSSQGVRTVGKETVMLNCMFLPEFMDPFSLSRIGNTTLTEFFTRPHDANAHLVLHGDHEAVLRLMMNAASAYFENERMGYPESAFYTFLLVTELARNGVTVHGDMAHQYPNAAFVDSIRKFIFDHIRDIGLDRLSEEYGYNKAYLSDMISRTTGMKFTEHVRLVRISYAKDLLERTQLPIDQIAYQAGFSNQSWFYQVFKQETGLTPGDYREMISCD